MKRQDGRVIRTLVLQEEDQDQAPQSSCLPVKLSLAQRSPGAERILFAVGNLKAILQPTQLQQGGAAWWIPPPTTWRQTPGETEEL